MPGWARTVVDANPVSHLVTTVRNAMAGHVATGQVAAVLVTVAAAVVVFAPLTMRAYARKS